MSQKCQAKVKSGKQCPRDSHEGHLHCQQHVEIQCVEHLKSKQTQNIKSQLIPDLERMVMEYLTPYEYYELIGLNKSHTLETYKRHQKKYEKQISNKIIEEYNQQLRELQQEYADTLLKFRDVTQEYKKMDPMIICEGNLALSQIPAITRTGRIKIKLTILRIEFSNLTDRFRELVSQKLKDANMFVFLQQNGRRLYGIDLDNTFTLPYNPPRLKKYCIVMDFDDLRIYESIGSHDIHIDKNVLSPLWILFRSFLDKNINLPHALPIAVFP